MSSTFVDQYQKDRDALMGVDGSGGDLQTAIAEQQAYTDSINAYKQGWENVMSHADPMKAYIYLFIMMANQGMDELTNKTATDAGSLQIQGDLTKLGNDMESLTTQDADVSKGYVKSLADHSDDMIANVLGNADIQRILDGNGQTTGPTSQLASQYKIIREMIYVNGSSSPYNPAYNPPIDPPPSPDNYNRTYYFIVGDPGHQVDPDNASQDDSMDSFGQLHDGLGLRGDPYQSNEAEKKLTDAFNENTSTTQSTNAASQEIVSNDQNNAKGVQSFIVAGLHSMTDVDSAAIKSATKSS